MACRSIFAFAGKAKMLRHDYGRPLQSISDFPLSLYKEKTIL
jgi:hypothetical protein